MLFAAGMGSRLYPLTLFKPKALVEFRGKTLLEIAITRLLAAGCKQIVVNVHHHAKLIIDCLNKNEGFGADIIISDESDLLLDTGGGLKKARKYLEGNEPFIVHNVDILSDLNLNELVQIHMRGKSLKLATLMVNTRESDRVFLINKENHLCGWKNLSTGETKIPIPSEDLIPASFCGIHVIDPKIFSLIEMEGVFSVVDLYLQLCKKNIIYCWRNDHSKWIDVGTTENLTEAEKYFF